METTTPEVAPSCAKSAASHFREVLEACERFVLTCHVNADGDALGSTLGLRRVLMNMGKQATVLTPDLAPSLYAWMPGYKTLRSYERETAACDALLELADCIAVMDYNDPGRVRALGEKIAASQVPLMMIDHHTDPKMTAEVFVSQPEAPATCLIVYDLLIAAGLGEYIDSEATTLFYAGLMTDTGGLSYNSSDPEIYLRVADMLRRGIDKDWIHDKIFRDKPFKRLKLQGYALGRKLHRIKGLPVAVMALDAEELERHNYTTGDTEGLVNIPLQARGVDISCLIMERDDGIKLSMRSKGDLPINEFAQATYNGGGHINAAGATYYGTIDDAVSNFERSIASWLAAHGVQPKQTAK